MFGYICIVIALVLALAPNNGARAFCVIVLMELLAHKLNYVFTQQLTDMLKGAEYYLLNIIIEFTAIRLLVMFKAPKVITVLILSKMLYNVAIISQYSFFTFNFYGSSDIFIRIIMVAELIFMSRFNVYAGIFGHRFKLKNPGSFYFDFRLGSWLRNRLVWRGKA